MKNFHLFLLLWLIELPLLANSFSQQQGEYKPVNELKAFPSAEGFGKYTTGGRGGKVVIVTSLADDGSEGTLRWALKQFPSDFTIVFAVGGTIELQSDLRCKARNFTIAGQTAPGDGICITKNEVNFGGSKNFIIRHLRFRPGDKDAAGNDLNCAALRVENADNFIIDHCSFSWTAEENADFIDTHFATVQYCIFSEGLYKSVNGKGARSYGAAFGGCSSTYHHNLFANNQSRTPRVNGGRGKDPGQDLTVYFEYINNVNYNWGSQMSTYGAENRSEDPEYYGFQGNFVNNYYKPGPRTKANVASDKLRFFRQSGGNTTDMTKAHVRGISKWHFGGNIMEGNDEITNNNDLGYYAQSNYPYTAAESLQKDFIIPTGKENRKQYWFDWKKYTLFGKYESAQDAYYTVLNEAGAFPRDKIDTRIIKEVKTGKSTYGNNGIIDHPNDAEGFIEYKGGKSIIDKDRDGMDDEWEKKVGLNPLDPSDCNVKNKLGYTALEVYINMLAGEDINPDF